MTMYQSNIHCMTICQGDSMDDNVPISEFANGWPCICLPSQYSMDDHVPNFYQYSMESHDHIPICISIIQLLTMYLFVNPKFNVWPCTIYQSNMQCMWPCTNPMFNVSPCTNQIFKVYPCTNPIFSGWPWIQAICHSLNNDFMNKNDNKAFWYHTFNRKMKWSGTCGITIKLIYLNILWF